MRVATYGLLASVALRVSADCAHNNAYRDLLRKSAVASPFCSSWNAPVGATSYATVSSSAVNCIATAPVTGAATTTVPPVPSGINVAATSLSSACSCLLGSSSPGVATATATVTVYNTPSAACASVTAIPLRIEGATGTIFEDIILAGPANVTTSSGGTHLCDGRNDNSNPVAGGTATTALQAAAQLKGFPFDGTFDGEFDDFFITSIGSDTQTATQFWGLLKNFQFTPSGGCQTEDPTGDEILWAYDAFNKSYFLKLSGPSTATAGVPFTVTVTDGSSGSPIAGASVGGQTTDANGHATITYPAPGVQTLKADKSDSIRSNALKVTVS